MSWWVGTHQGVGKRGGFSCTLVSSWKMRVTFDLRRDARDGEGSAATKKRVGGKQAKQGIRASRYTICISLARAMAFARLSTWSLP